MAVLAAAAVMLVVPWPAWAAKADRHPFRYGIDISSWYWQRQIDEEVAPPLPLPPPVPPVSQRARLPSPQRPDTMPVAVFEGQHERMAAIKFDLAERGVTPGSEIDQLVLEIEESTDRNELPSVNPAEANIQACVILDVLTGGENERFADRPQYSESDCVEGKRQTPPAPAAPRWTFDLTELAAPWAEDPFSNNGVMLLGLVEEGGAAETWQVNLKIPSRDDDGTEVDEYDQTKSRAVLTLEFVPGEDPFADPAGSLDTGGTGASGSGPLGGGGGVPSTDLPGAGASPPAPPASETPDAGTTPAAAVAPPEPRLPPAVWLVIPLGLLGLAAVRSVVLEPAGGLRPGGVIEAIRARNAERRGGLVRAPSDPLAAAAAAFAAAGRGILGGARSIGRRLAAPLRRSSR